MTGTFPGGAAPAASGIMPRDTADAEPRIALEQNAPGDRPHHCPDHSIQARRRRRAIRPPSPMSDSDPGPGTATEMLSTTADSASVAPPPWRRFTDEIDAASVPTVVAAT